MNRQPTLEDELILLRPLHQDDYAILYEVAKDPLIWEQHQANDRWKPEVFTQFFEDAMNSGGALIAIEKSSDTVIGSSRYQPHEDTDSAIEIGWTFLSRDYWGGKFNQSMKKLMIDYALQFKTDILLHIDKNNIRSQKAAAKIGGKKITEPHLKHLLKKSDTNLTFRISDGE